MPPKKKQKLGPTRMASFLEGISVYLHPAAMSKTRKQILHREVVSNGGSLVRDLRESEANLLVHVLLDSSIIVPDHVHSIVKKVAGFGSPSSLVFLSANWLSECLRCKALVAKDEFMLGDADLEAEPAPSAAATPVHVHSTEFREKFVCSKSSSDPSKLHNFNQTITDELEKLANAYKNSNDKWRCFGYEKAIAAVKRHPKPISSRAEAAGIRGVGSKMADKVEEILNSGTLRKVKEVCEGEKAKTLLLFGRIWGVGPTTAESWYAQGFRTLQDLEEKAKLTRHQRVGIRLFEELGERMSREEAFAIERTVKEHADRITQGLEVIGCGSYRRQKPDCGDLDVLVTHEDDSVLEGLFEKLLSSMRESRFLTDDLVMQTNGSQKKYLGVCRLPETGSKHRRLDIIVAPYVEKATALMYFTGSAHFNRSMRLFAIKMGMSLSEHSLRKDVARHNKQKLNHGTVLHTPTEVSVFEHLGLEYRKPHERDH